MNRVAGCLLKTIQQSQHAHPSCLSSLAASSRRTHIDKLGAPPSLPERSAPSPSTLRWHAESVLLHCQHVSLPTLQHTRLRAIHCWQILLGILRQDFTGCMPAQPTSFWHGMLHFTMHQQGSLLELEQDVSSRSQVLKSSVCSPCLGLVFDESMERTCLRRSAGGTCLEEPSDPQESPGLQARQCITHLAGGPPVRHHIG